MQCAVQLSRAGLLQCSEPERRRAFLPDAWKMAGGSVPGDPCVCDARFLSEHAGIGLARLDDSQDHR